MDEGEPARLGSVRLGTSYRAEWLVEWNEAQRLEDRRHREAAAEQPSTPAQDDDVIMVTVSASEGEDSDPEDPNVKVKIEENGESCVEPCEQCYTHTCDVDAFWTLTGEHDGPHICNQCRTATTRLKMRTDGSIAEQEKLRKKIDPQSFEETEQDRAGGHGRLEVEAEERVS